MSSSIGFETEKNVEYEKMFLDKLTLLNRTFLKVIESCVKDMPDADLVSFWRAGLITSAPYEEAVLNCIRRNFLNDFSRQRYVIIWSM